MPIKFGISFNRPALNQAGALVHVYTDGSVVAQPRRHRDGPGPVHQGRAGGGGSLQHRSRPHPRVGHLAPARCRTPRRPRPPPAPISTAWRRSMPPTQIKARMTEVAAEHFGVPAARHRVLGEPHLCRQPQHLVPRACRAVVGEARVAVGDRLLPHAEDSLGLRHQHRAGRSTTSPMARRLPRSRSIRSPARPACCAPSCCRIAAARSTRRSISARSKARSCRAWAGSPPRNCGGTRRAGCARTGRRPTRFPAAATCRRSSMPASWRTRRTGSDVFRSKAVGEPPLMLAISVYLAIRDAIASLAGHRRSPQARRAGDAGACPRRDRRPAQPGVIEALRPVRIKKAFSKNSKLTGMPSSHLRST